MLSTDGGATVLVMGPPGLQDGNRAAGSRSFNLEPRGDIDPDLRFTFYTSLFAR
jgi:hypothetical protein